MENDTITVKQQAAGFLTIQDVLTALGYMLQMQQGMCAEAISAMLVVHAEVLLKLAEKNGFFQNPHIVRHVLAFRKYMEECENKNHHNEEMAKKLTEELLKGAFK